MAIWDARIRSFNGSSEMFTVANSHAVNCSISAAAPTRTGTICRLTGPLDSSQRRRTTTIEEHRSERDHGSLDRVDDLGGALVGRDGEDVQPILGHPEQEPEELERDDHEQEEADDRAVCSRP